MSITKAYQRLTKGTPKGHQRHFSHSNGRIGGGKGEIRER